MNKETPEERKSFTNQKLDEYREYTLEEEKEKVVQEQINSENNRNLEERKIALKKDAQAPMTEYKTNEPYDFS